MRGTGAGRSSAGLIIAVLALLAQCAAAAAADASHIHGVVRDALERPLAGAAVRLETSDGQVAAQTTTGDTGAYDFAGVAAGSYAVIVTKEGFETATAIVTVPEAQSIAQDLVLASTQPLDLTLLAKRLDVARASIEPRVGASTYDITRQAIENQPEAENNPLNQVILQAPGVAQDSFGVTHVRGEHIAVQYRINGIILPEGISGFGQALSPRFANKVELITGALPAEYGLRTAGILDIETRSGAYEPGGNLGIYGGSRDRIQPSGEYGGSSGRFSYFATGDYLQDNIGIESATPGPDPIHDDTQQGHGFAYASAILDPSTRVSTFLGTYRGQFQIANQLGLEPSLGLTVNGQTAFPSTQLNENQREINHYGVLAAQRSEDFGDFQLAGFSRYSSLQFHPDPVGDLLFNGVAQDAYRRDFANGIQGDGSYRATDTHTLRAGFFLIGERAISKTNSLVLPVDSTGAQTSDVPVSIIDNAGKTGWTYSTYLQDEWRIFPNFTFNFGGRFDQVDQFTHENQLSPRANAVYQPTDTTTLHAGYARYFTPPPFELVSTTSTSKFIGTTNQPAVLTNTTVRAERADYFDVGAAQKIIPGLQAGIDTYYKTSRNLIDEGQFGAPIILTPFNYHYGRQYGVELTTTYDQEDISAYGNIAFARAEGTKIASSQFLFSQDDLDYISHHFIALDHDQFITASAGATYNWRGIRFGPDLLFGTGLRRTEVHPNDATVPQYMQVNFGVSNEFDVPTFGKFEVRFDVINVFDATYKIRSGTGVGVFAPQFGPRRAFFGGLKKLF